MLFGENQVKAVCRTESGPEVDQFMPDIDWRAGGGGEGRHLKSENMYWTEIKASVPKELMF